MKTYHTDLPEKYDYYGDTTEIVEYINKHKLYAFLSALYTDIERSTHDVYHLSISLHEYNDIDKLDIKIYTNSTFTIDCQDKIKDMIPRNIQNYIELSFSRD